MSNDSLKLTELPPVKQVSDADLVYVVHKDISNKASLKTIADYMGAGDPPVLENDLMVNTPAGSVKSGRVYAKGSTLEYILRDILIGVIPPTMTPASFNNKLDPKTQVYEVGSTVTIKDMPIYDRGKISWSIYNDGPNAKEKSTPLLGPPIKYQILKDGIVVKQSSTLPVSYTLHIESGNHNISSRVTIDKTAEQPYFSSNGQPSTRFDAYRGKTSITASEKLDIKGLWMRYTSVGKNYIGANQEPKGKMTEAFDSTNTFTIQTGTTAKKFAFSMIGSRKVIKIFDKTSGFEITNAFKKLAGVAHTTPDGQNKKYDYHEMIIALPFTTNHILEITLGYK